jgi:hypothetical protein
MLPTEHQQNAIDIFSIFKPMSATYLSPPDSCAPRSMLQMSWAFYGVVVGNNTSSFNYFHHFLSIFARSSKIWPICFLHLQSSTVSKTFGTLATSSMMKFSS